ncbi:tRNA 2-thiouridine(34) synthase MnmA, partial [Fulvivirga sp. RKSG066]|uniref:tRNA 2-thiouridine(34) synthase MnmA n=1 Tax=Fulvivirga aurantia TaxID=2529383 RepID=UPI0012BBF31F
LLKEQGYEVIGMFMKNWHDDSVTISDECPWLEDSNDAMIVAQKLGIPFQAIDLSAEYKKRIVDYMFDEYQKGRTPNPDVLCNREIKFDIFLKAAMRLNADYIATGHYCRRDEIDDNGETLYQLKAGKDNNKDQSYFLCQLTQEQLSKALFPIGELTKPEVREIAKVQDLITADKKDSQGLCFIGKVRLPEFLQQQLKPKKGDVIEVPADSDIYNEDTEDVEVITDSLDTITAPFVYQKSSGKKVGEHNGAHYFTIGQRKGLNIGGTPEPLFIIDTDTKNNIIYTGQGENHPGLYRKGLFIEEGDIHWVRPDIKLTVGETRDYMVRIRYRQPLEKAQLIKEANGLYIIFDQPQKAIAAGQFAVWYSEDELVGSGVIA